MQDATDADIKKKLSNARKTLAGVLSQIDVVNHELMVRDDQTDESALANVEASRGHVVQAYAILLTVSVRLGG